MRGRRGGSRTGTFLVLVGIVGVLSATFVAGLWTGRNWPVIVGNPRSPAAVEAPATKPRATGERPRPAEPLPALTFYQDLKAPLTAPPPPPKPAKPRPPEPKSEEPLPTRDALPPTREALSKIEAPPAARTAPTLPPATLPPAAASGPRFTVQVAAYNVKPLAEALRGTLAAAGHDARVVESEGGVRYRVQVGTFPTREAAREAAARLAAERSQPTFVTTR
jgi:cell division septation protein DedD